MMYFHMSSGGPFFPGYRQDDVKGLMVTSPGVSVVHLLIFHVPRGQQTCTPSQIQHLIADSFPIQC
jgi:hypothetical protein